MSDLGLRSFFFANDPTDPRVNSTLRQRIALAMMSGKRPLPKTLGEGLGAIGEAIGDIGTERRLLAADKAQQEAALAIPPTTPEVAGVAGAAGSPGVAAPAAAAPPVPTAAATDDINRTYAPEEYNPIDQAATLREQRAPYMAQLEKDPGKMLTAAALMTSEEGAGAKNAGARMAVAESMLNRGVARGIPSVGKVMDPRYYEPMQNGNFANHVAMLNANPKLKAQVFNELRNVAGANPEMQATNVSNLATDNASGDVARRGMGNQTLTYVAPNQESFFRKDVRPDVHGAANVAATQDWYRKTAVDQPGDARARIATAAAAPPAAPPPPSPPVMAFSGDQGNASFSPNNAQPFAQQPPIPSAPPLQPPQRVAQAGQPAPVPGYVMPAESEPTAPERIQPSEREMRLENFVKQGAASNPYIAQGPAAQELAQLKANREYQQAKQDEVYKERLSAFRAKDLKRQEQLSDQAKRVQEYQTGSLENVGRAGSADIVQRTGMTPEQFWPRMDKAKAAVDNTVRSQDTQAIARQAIREGVITGFGANAKVNAAKFADFAFKNGMKGDLAANTEIMKTMLQNSLAEAVSTVNGEGGRNVSDTDVKIAQGVIGSDPELQKKTILAIMDQASAINNLKIDRYERQVDKFLGGHPQEENYSTLSRQVAPKDHVDKLLADPSETTRAYFDRTYGPGAADLAIARAERKRKREGR